MFDLFRSRAKNVRYLLTALLGLVALSMVITLIPGFGSPSAQRNDQVIAEIGDTQLTARMVSQVIQSQMRNQNMSPAVAGLMAPQIIRKMIGEYSTILQAERMGFTVSETELAQGIRVLFPQLFEGGMFVGKEVYAQMMAQMGITIPEFENQARRQLMLMKLQGMVAQGVLVTPTEIEDEFRKRHEKAKLAIVKFGAEDFEKTINPSQAELQAYLNSLPQRFQMAEKKDVTILSVDEARLGANIPVDEAALRQMYASQQDRFRTEERVRSRHILLKADASTPAEEKAKIKAKAEDLLKQIKAGADFAAMAKKHSEDTGSGSRGGDLDWTNRAGFVKPFSDAAFALKPKDISGIVESEFGYHIIQTMEKENARVKPFEEVREELAADARRDQLRDKMPALADQARAALAKDPSQAEQIAQSLNLTVTKLDNFEVTSDIPGAGTSRQLQYAISTLAKGGVSDVVQVENKYMIAAVREVHPARPATLAEKQREVRDAFIASRAIELAETKAREFETKLRANNNDLEKTAKEFGVKVTETNEFTRTEQIDNVGPAAYFGEQPFINKVGQVVNVFRVASKSFFYRIIAQTPADKTKLEADRDDIVNTVRERKMRERRELFEEGLVDRLTKEGDVKVYDDVIERLVASYRS